MNAKHPRQAKSYIVHLDHDRVSFATERNATSYLFRAESTMDGNFCIMLERGMSTSKFQHACRTVWAPKAHEMGEHAASSGSFIEVMNPKDACLIVSSYRLASSNAVSDIMKCRNMLLQMFVEFQNISSKLLAFILLTMQGVLNLCAICRLKAEFLFHLRAMLLLFL